MKKLFIGFCILSLTVSCSDRDSSPAIVKQKNTYNFNFSGNYKVDDIHLFKGPNAVDERPKEDFIQKTWSSYKTPEYNSIEIDLDNEIIHLKSDSYFINHLIETSNDSIFTSSNKVLTGILDRKNEKFELLTSFYYIKKNISDQGLFYSRSTKLRKTKFSDLFGEHNFIDPSEMTEKDEVFWANLTFSYSQL